MPTVTLSCGDIDYSDSGGSGPVLVFTHGVLMNHELWDPVADALGDDFRCIALTLPLGAHEHPMAPGTDLGTPGVAAIAGEFLDKLDLKDVTLVVNAVGAPLLLAADRHPRVGALVLATCEVFTDQFPGQRGKNLKRFATIPDGIRAAIAMLRAPGAAKVSATFGAMTKKGIPGRLIKHWTAPGLAQEAVREDLKTYIESASPDELDAGTKRLVDFKGPVLIVWAGDERMHESELPKRLQELLPESRLVLIEDSYALLPLDQPEELAGVLREFLSQRAAA